MGTIKNIVYVITKRPYLLIDYICDAIRYILNYYFIKLTKGPNIIIGSNYHILSAKCFHVERDNAKLLIGNDFAAGTGSKIYVWGKGNVEIGNFSSIGNNTIIHCFGKISIGNHVMIAFDVLILDSDGHPINQQERCLEIESYHSLLFPRFGKQQIKKYSPVLSIKPVIIEDNVWIGAKSIILKGVKIGKGAIIGAGSVVVGDVHPGTIVSGNPAKNIVSL